MNSQHLNTIPKSWILTTLENVSTKITDGTHKTPKYQSEGIKFISIKNIRPFKPINWDSYEKYISIAEHRQLIKRCHPERNDILFPRIGTLGFAKRIDFDEEVSIFVGLGLIKPVKKYVLPKYIEFYMNTAMINNLSHKKATGTGRKTIALEESRRFPFPLPSLPEQHRIVAKIEELFSDLDNAIESLKKAKEQLKTYRQAVLKWAFEGKLTEEWRKQNNPEPAEILLEKIKEEREKHYQHQLKNWEQEVKNWEEGDKKGKKPKKPQKLKENKHFTMDELEALPILPNSWSWIQIDKLAGYQKNSIKAGPFGSSLKKEFYVEDGYKIYGQEQVISGDHTYGDYYVNENKFKELESCKVKTKDILISLVGTVGKVLILPENIEAGIINPRLIKISPNSYYSPKFFKCYFESVFLKNTYQTKSHGATMKILNLSIIQELPFVLCTIEEQKQIVEEIESRLSVCDNIETNIEETLSKADALRQSILKKAFEGKLVPQDPDDEPASQLLEKIKAEKAKVNTSNKMSKIKQQELNI